MKTHLNNRKGFTLIELLVVISVIGLLSSVVLASVSTARDRGRVAAAITFAKHSNTKLYDDTKLFLNFDDSANRLKDSSWNNTTVTGTVGTDSSTYSGNYNAATLGVVTNSTYLTVTSNTGLKSIQKGTVMVWVKTTNKSLQGIFSMGDSATSPKLSLFSNGVVTLVNSSGVGATQHASSFNLTDGKWHNVAVAFNGAIAGSVYIDGKLIIPSSGIIYTDFAGNIDKTFYIGQIIAANFPYNGSIDDVAVYSSILLGSDIQRLYAEGLKTHTLADNK